MNEDVGKLRGQQAIGGFFELELHAGAEFHPTAYGYQSGRAAFLAFLLAVRPRRVWMPRYICSSMLGPLDTAGVSCSFYRLDEEFGIADNLLLSSGDLLFYVNYFGICTRQIHALQRRFPLNRLIVDNAQAFFSLQPNCLAAIYSPRKYFGVPDGGYLITDESVDQSLPDDAGSLGRMAHLLKRIAGDVEQAHEHFREAERSLEGQMPRGMSELTHRLLRSIDYGHAARQRRENYHYLHENLKAINRLKMELTSTEVPLCYPFWHSVSGLRQRLVAQRIYVPTYWQEVTDRVEPSSSEAEWVQKLIPLPIDQRYGKMEMDRILDVVRTSVEW